MTNGITRFKSLKDLSNYSHSKGPGLHITFRCIDCNNTASRQFGRFIKGTRIFRCMTCWDKRKEKNREPQP